jgi:hypothetical protein
VGSGAGRSTRSARAPEAAETTEEEQGAVDAKRGGTHPEEDQEEGMTTKQRTLVPLPASLLDALPATLFQPLLVLSDCYEEAGEPYMALAWQYLATHQRFPRCYPSGKWWVWLPWGTSDPLQPRDALCERLPCLTVVRRRSTLPAIFLCGAMELAQWFAEGKKEQS